RARLRLVNSEPFSVGLIIFTFERTSDSSMGMESQTFATSTAVNFLRCSNLSLQRRLSMYKKIKGKLAEVGYVPFRATARCCGPGSTALASGDLIAFMSVGQPAR